MSNAISINVSKREEFGSANARRMRNEGVVPAVIYAHGAEAVSLAVTQDELAKLAGHNGMIELCCSCGAKKMAVIKEVQRNPITNLILHVDFLEVKADEKISVTVPLQFVGEAAGTKQGGQLETVVHELVVECLPGNVPEIITVDVSALELEQACKVADLKLDNGIVAKEDGELILCHVRIPHAAAEPAAAPAEAEAAAPAAKAADAKK